MINKIAGLYVAEIKRKYKEKVYTTYLLRRSYRENGKVKQQTLANLTHLPGEIRDLIRQKLKGSVIVPLEEKIQITRSLHYGHVAAVRTMLRRLGLHTIISSHPCRERDLVEALIVSRIVNAQTKLSTTRWWSTTTLPEDLGILDATEDDVYDAMDWLVQRQARIEKKLASRHLEEEGLVLYDVSSSYYEGKSCPLASFGYNRDKKKGKQQIVYGLMTNGDGCPVAVEVFPGKTGDPSTIDNQITKLKERFALDRVILAGDRGMLTNVRIEKLREVGGIDWVSALRAPAIRHLIEDGYLQPSLFDETDLMEISCPDYADERLIVCRNPFLAEDRYRTRQELLAATEEKLASLARRVDAGRLKHKEKIGEALGRIANKYRMAKHFIFTIDEDQFTYERNQESIASEELLDGFYVIRTSVSKEKWNAEQAILGYKSLSRAERAFRTLKGIDLKIRPIHHRLTERVRAHVFLCFLAYYVEWHLRQAWQPLIFDDEDPGRHLDDSPVRPALRSEDALRKARTKRREDGTIVHSFRSLLAELGTVVRNEARTPALPEMGTFFVVTDPNPIQREAFELVGLNWNTETRRHESAL